MQIGKLANGGVVQFGPVVDKTDGVTPLTSLASALDNATTGIKISKNGGTFAVRHATVTSSVYDTNGFYKVTLDSTDYNTLGIIQMSYSDPATCRPIIVEVNIVPANIFDALKNTDVFQVDVAQWLNAVAPAMTGDAFASIATLLTRIASNLTITNGKIDINDKTGFSLSTVAAEAIWTVGTRTLTSFGTLVADITTAVWGAGTRTLTSFGTLVADGAAAVWASVTRSLTDKAGFSISGTKQTLDALNDISAAAVWSVGTRTLTSFGTLVADIATAVWGAGTRTLTSFGTLVADGAAAVWANVTRSLTDKIGFKIYGTKQTLDDLHDLSTGDIDARLEAFDPPTKAELDAAQLVITNAISALHNATQGATAGELAAVQLAITNAISALHNATQGATKTELDAAVAAIEGAMPSVAGLAVEDGGRLADIQERTDRLPDVPAAKGDIPTAVDLTALTVLVTRALGLAGENLVMDQTVFDGDNKLTGARIRIYDSAIHALAAGDTGLIATFPLSMTWASKLLATMTQVKS